MEISKRSQQQREIRNSPQRYKSVKSKVGRNLKVQRSQKNILPVTAQSVSEHVFKNFVAQGDFHETVDVLGTDVKVNKTGSRSANKKLSQSVTNLSPIKQRAIQ